MAKFAFKANVANVAHIANMARWLYGTYLICHFFLGGAGIFFVKGVRCKPLMDHLPNMSLSRLSGFYFPEEENCCLCGVKSNGVSIILALCRGLVS